MAFQAVQFIDIAPEDAGQRVDNYLFRLLKGVPKSRVYRLLRKGEVRLNGGRIKPEYKLEAGDRLRLPPIRTGDPEAATGPSHSMVEKLASSIIYEDDRMLVINKPAGMASHGGSGVNAGVIEGLRALRPRARRLELVHRLDRGTSGCLMIAKNRTTLAALQKALRDKTGIEKVYTALVQGEWPTAREVVSLPLRRDTLEGGGRVVRVADDGKPAETRFRVLARSKKATLLEVRPLTGRTHQIRVHCASSGHPVLGDERYGGDLRDVPRLMLHAARLVFPDDTGRRITVEADPDEPFGETISRYIQ